MIRRYSMLSASLVAMALFIGCAGESKTEPTTEEQQKIAAEKKADGGSPSLLSRITSPSKPVTVPAGTSLTVRLNETLGSDISKTGQTFTATLTQPIKVNGETIVESGADVKGTVVSAKSLGRFKGAANLQLRLTSIEAGGKDYDVTSSLYSRAIKGKGKRSTVMIGGGAGAGALIGAIAGGGKGAAIGAAAGAGAGTAGAGLTGDKDIVLPAETPVTFKLTEAVVINK